jgi:hypothetical protein
MDVCSSPPGGQNPVRKRQKIDGEQLQSAFVRSRSAGIIDLLLLHLDDEEELVIPRVLNHGERPLI